MKVLSFGEILFDIFPEKSCLGGAPLNFAAHLAAQGCSSAILSSVGNDELGKEAIKQIKAFGVDTSLINVTKNNETGKCIVYLDEKGLPCYSLLNNVAYDYIDFPNTSNTEKFDTFAFGTLALRNNHNRLTVAECLSKNNFKTVYCDLNLRSPYYSKETVEFCLKNCTILKLSDEEYPIVAKMVLGNTPNEKIGLNQIAKTFPQIELIIYTLGSKGSALYSVKEDKYIKCDAQPCKIVSTVGAGDSFGATFLAQLSFGKEHNECLKAASKVSAFVVSNSGAIPKGLKEFLANNI